MRFHAVIPGRLLHVRCSLGDFDADLLCAYQWSWNGAADKNVEAKRRQLWTTASRHIGSLPRRNPLLIGGDFNCSCEPKSGYVGLGVLKSAAQQRAGTMEFMNVLVGCNLCVLNTWQSSRSSVSATYVFGEQRTQIDFLITRRGTADLLAKQAKISPLDLAPWRSGSKHKWSVPLFH